MAEVFGDHEYGNSNLRILIIFSSIILMKGGQINSDIEAS